ncbi:S9 family peptidase [uncultured Anaerococcus sp.]|uniref:alpha/beta hydrolase family protein n=1 Tax=uncultured Anaerococcus sp. TaxID=293428 RepID=UPI00288C368A|nr:S9 family peptidase [uncultured Anaerococcus sp.]
MTEIKDILSYDFLSELVVSNDGNKIAYKKTKANEKDNKYDTDLFVYDKILEKSYRLTDSGDNPICSFDKENNLIYKRYTDDKTDNFYISDGAGLGEELFKLDLDVKSIKWLRDDIFLISASKKKSKEEKETDKENSYFKELTTLPFWFNGVGFLKDSTTYYYLYKLSDKSLTEILKSDKDNSVGILDIDDNIEKIVYTRSHEDSNRVMEFLDSIILKDLKTGEEKILSEKSHSIYTIKFLENEIVFVGSDLKLGGINEDCFIYKIDGEGKISKINDDDFDKSFGNSIGTDARFGAAKTFQVKNNRLYFVVTEKEESKLYSINLKGDLRLELDGCIEDFSVTDDDIYYLEMAKDSLAELKEKSTGKSLVENKIKSPVYPIEEFNFESNGDTLKGYVLLPKDFDKNKKYPCLLSVHGGPKTEFSDIFHHEHQTFASNGYMVIYTNPHGSSGNGVKYSDIRGKYGDIDFSDLMNFTDLAIEKYPQIDPDRMAIYGGSYGGFMTNWAIGHTDRFKAACAQRSISNWTSFYGVSDIGYYFATDQTASNPYDSLDKMWDQSPIKYADKVKTPTLFIHSDEDYRCPLEQGLQMYNRIKLNGVDTKMFLFHGENHELSRSGKPKARIKRLTEIKNWFDRYLKDEDIKE